MCDNRFTSSLVLEKVFGFLWLEIVILTEGFRIIASLLHTKLCKVLRFDHHKKEVNHHTRPRFLLIGQTDAIYFVKSP
jgi:hypothetical protein